MHARCTGVLVFLNTTTQTFAFCICGCVRLREARELVPTANRSRHVRKQSEETASPGARPYWRTLIPVRTLGFVRLAVTKMHLTCLAIYAEGFMSILSPSRPIPWQYTRLLHCSFLPIHYSLNLLATDFFFQILAHPVFKMWVIQKPNKVALWNNRRFEEKKWRLYSMFKIFSTDICWINIKWGI